MNKVKKITVMAVLEQLLPLILGLACVLIMTVNSLQASLAIPFRLTFEGKYSFDGGESWQVLTADSDLSTSQGDLLLRGHFNEDIFPGGILYEEIHPAFDFDGGGNSCGLRENAGGGSPCIGSTCGGNHGGHCGGICHRACSH